YGRPGVRAAKSAVAGDGEDRYAALADVGPVGAGDTEHIQPEIRAVVGGHGAQAQAAVAHVSVHQEVRRDRPGMTDGPYLHQRVARFGAAVAQTRPARRPEGERTVHQRLHHAVLAPDGMGVRAVPVNLHVAVVPVKYLRP